MEDYWMGKVSERIFLPTLKLVLPEIVDINMPAEGVFHNLVIVSIKKEFPGHAQREGAGNTRKKRPARYTPVP